MAKAKILFLSLVCLTAIWKNRALDCSLHLQPTNTSHQPDCRGSRLLIVKLLKSISQSWPQSASSNRPLHSTRLQNGQVKGKVENEDEQSRIVQSSNQKLSPRVRLLAEEASSKEAYSIRAYPLAYPDLRSRFRCRLLISPNLENASKTSSSWIYSWRFVTIRIHPSTAA